MRHSPVHPIVLNRPRLARQAPALPSFPPRTPIALFLAAILSFATRDRALAIALLFSALILVIGRALAPSSSLLPTYQTVTANNYTPAKAVNTCTPATTVNTHAPATAVNTHPHPTPPPTYEDSALDTDDEDSGGSEDTTPHFPRTPALGFQELPPRVRSLSNASTEALLNFHDDESYERDSPLPLQVSFRESIMMFLSTALVLLCILAAVAGLLCVIVLTTWAIKLVVVGYVAWVMRVITVCAVWGMRLVYLFDDGLTALLG